jgi:hypothetical protein
MTVDRFTYTTDDTPTLFLSQEAAEKAVLKSLMAVCFAFGFDTVQEDDTEILCGKHSTSQLVAVRKSGDWEYRDANEDLPVSETGEGATMLRYLLEQL